jgi:hypothetical protein
MARHVLRDSQQWEPAAPWFRRGDPCPRCREGALRLVFQFSGAYLGCSAQGCGWVEINGRRPHPNFTRRTP